ncbi:MAG: DUF2062 domain-containing protein [Candidatus Omnitrophota bacterium]
MGSCRVIQSIYRKIFLINDTPQKVSLGLGIGVFLGIVPGTGPLAAVFVAFILGLNRFAAFLGGIIVNTWFTIAAFPVAIKIGASLLGVDGRAVYQEALSLVKNFHLADLFRVSVLKIILPLSLGYLIIAFSCGLTAYLLCLVILLGAKKRKDRGEEKDNGCRESQ